MSLRFVKPSMDYIPSFIRALEEGPFTHMAMGYFGDTTAEVVRTDPQAYLDLLNNPSPRNVTTPNGEVFTFSDHYIIWVGDEKCRFLAGISFRFDDNELINNFCGHAGMSVRPSLLKKGYGVKAACGMVEFAISEVKKRGLSRFLASANPDNPASYRILEHLGGCVIAEHDPYGYGMTRLYEKKL